MIDLKTVFADGEAPNSGDSLASGRALARDCSVGDSAFLSEYGVASEIDYKQKARAEGRITHHAQIGWRDPAKTGDAWAAIHAATEKSGGAVDRYGICLDWSMGYPKASRGAMGRGTGLILEGPEDFKALTCRAPVAPHFGDFTIGLPAALENTQCALVAGATAIGNLGQYFTFRMPGWPEDRETTAATVSALALCAAQPVPILIHSNLDDGFAAQFTDLACAFGAVLLERYIVEDLIGGVIGHCYGHTFSDPLSRFAFQRALAEGRDDIPGTMVYGNTTAYREAVPEAENYGALAAYLSVDIAAQRAMASGHAITPIPVTEADRIPDVDEVIEAQLFALSLQRRRGAPMPLLETTAADAMKEELIAGGHRFFEAVMEGLAASGLNTRDPEALLLALRRIGAKRLEELFGPGEEDDALPRGRRPLVEAPPVAELRALAQETITCLSDEDRQLLRDSDLAVVVGSTDVHEFGKLLSEQTLSELGIVSMDAGIHAEPDDLADMVAANRLSAIVLGTYNGVALDYADALVGAMAKAGVSVPIFIGGKLNQIAEGSNTSLPRPVAAELAARGLTPCARMEDMLAGLAAVVRERTSS